MTSGTFRTVLRAIGTYPGLRLGLRRRIVGRFYPAGRSPSYGFEIPYHGASYKGDIAIAQDWHVYFFGGYELKEAALMKDVLGAMERPVALDVGANLGGHTLAMAPYAAEVHAFEPFGPLADVIARRMSECSIRNVHLHRFGLGEEDVVQPYYLDQTSTNSGTGSFIVEHAGAPEAGKLQLRRGDGWAQGRTVDFIKIDVEGYEAPALLGMRSLLAANQPVLMMEVTETSWRMFGQRGGIAAVLPFEFDAYEICNPPYALGILQFRKYSLKPVASIQPRGASFNLLLVPRARADSLKKLLGKA